MASDRLAVVLPTNQNPGLKILVNQHGAYHGNSLVHQASELSGLLRQSDSVALWYPRYIVHIKFLCTLLANRVEEPYHCVHFTSQLVKINMSISIEAHWRPSDRIFWSTITFVQSWSTMEWRFSQVPLKSNWRARQSMPGLHLLKSLFVSLALSFLAGRCWELLECHKVTYQKSCTAFVTSSLTGGWRVLLRIMKRNRFLSMPAWSHGGADQVN